MKPSNCLLSLAMRTLLERAEAFTLQVRRVRSPTGIEDIHQARVASRRLRSALGLFEAFLGKRARRWRKRVGKIARALGRARDLDVQIEFLRGHLRSLRSRLLREGPEALLVRLQYRRREAQREVRRALRSFVPARLLDDLREAMNGALARAEREGTAQPRVRRELAGVLRGLAGDVLTHKDVVMEPGREEELHEMRIQVKRLRYALEILAPVFTARGRLGGLLERLETLQELLGDIHDCDVWVNLLGDRLRRDRRRRPVLFRNIRPTPASVPGLEDLLENRLCVRRERSRRLVRFWSKSRLRTDVAALKSALRVREGAFTVT